MLLYFQLIQRPLFYIYNRRESDRSLRLIDVWHIIVKGGRSDVISVSYLTALPLILFTVATFTGGVWLRPVLTAYNVIAGIVLGVTTVVDCGLYPYWKFKLDASVLPYIRAFKSAVSSVSTGFVILAFVALAVVISLCFLWLQAVTGMALGGVPFKAAGVGQHVGVSMAFLIEAACLFAMIRGLGRRPNNPSVSFFSHVPFFNHVALNPLYSFIYSLSVNDKIDGAFHKFDDDDCSREFNELYPAYVAPKDRLIKTTRPNVLFIIWESLSSRFVESLGGQPGVTPNIDRLAREGVMFTHLDCNSFRTDRGLVALLSGYLAQPTTSVIRMSKKLPHLPALPRRFKELGYETTAVHGGDLTIFHKAEYYLTVGHDRLMSQDDLPKELPTGKWGVHDHAVMEWLFDDIMDKTRRGVQWFTTLQTLSSHEPWMVPYGRLASDPVANTFAYVDDALGKLVDRLRETEAWDNLLIVVTGDHGCNTGQYLPPQEYARVPLLLTGGAVAGPRRIDTIMSQTDIAATLLGQMGLNHDEFIFSRDVMAESYTYPFSFHTFVNGFMFRDETGYTVVDNVSDKAVIEPDETREHRGRVILQYLYSDLAKR
ncbi:MAG: sulfatase-like hydrolase/transferase [Duncaniella sp.]|nr:sulfatase-like hydrolase/transferase [Duncaniella sp.]